MAAPYDDDDDIPDGSETEYSGSADEQANAEADADTHVLKMLYKGNIAEVSREEGKGFNLDEIHILGL